MATAGREASKERTLVVIKPDGVQRGLIGEVIRRYERIGFKLAGIKMVVPTAEMIEKHYLVNPDWKVNVGTKNLKAYKEKGIAPPTDDPLAQGEMVLGKLKSYFTSGPVIAMVWQGMHVVEVVRKLTGGTEPLTSDVGTIRGDFSIDSYQVSDIDNRAVRNIVHASGNINEAEKEIALWFSNAEVINYRLVAEEILYDVNLDGILE